MTPDAPAAPAEGGGAPPDLERRTRRRLLVSAALVCAGIVLCVAVDDGLGGWVTLAAMASLLLAIHRLGRSGPA